jgi:hypothetical protein
MNQGWLTRSSTIANSHGPFDPQEYGFSPVDFSNYGNEYNDALMNIVGTITEGDAVYNYNKSGTTLPVGAPLKRDYRWNEYEVYAQDTWKILNNLTLTYGVRYSYLQAPAETSGTQVGTCQFSGSICKPYALTQYINGSAAQAAAGGAANNVGEVAFNLNGRYNHAADFWTPEKKDFGPRLAVAFSPAPDDGFWKMLFGNQKTSIRAGYSLVFDHFGAATVNTFDTTGSYGLSSHLSNAPGSVPIEDAPRFTTISGVPQSLLPSAPAGGFPAVPAASGNGSFAISWGLDSAVGLAPIREDQCSYGWRYHDRPAEYLAGQPAYRWHAICYLPARDLDFGGSARLRLSNPTVATPPRLHDVRSGHVPRRQDDLGCGEHGDGCGSL